MSIVIPLEASHLKLGNIYLGYQIKEKGLFYFKYTGNNTWSHGCFDASKFKGESPFHKAFLYNDGNVLPLLSVNLAVDHPSAKDLQYNPVTCHLTKGALASNLSEENFTKVSESLFVKVKSRPKVYLN